jgi:hypothetical protein
LYAALEKAGCSSGFFLPESFSVICDQDRSRENTQRTQQENSLTLSMIFTRSENGCIGRQGQRLSHLPDEFAGTPEKLFGIIGEPE